MNPEVFYLYIQGEQRGPYTVRQIDHQLNVGLIDETTTFWREGMEEAQPITNLVALRKRRKPTTRSLARTARWLILLVPLLLALKLFGPIAIVGWRETAQYDYTERSAYWRARHLIRQQALPKGSVIAFSTFEQSKVQMVPEPQGARVWVKTDYLPPGETSKTASWLVVMAYDQTTREWSGRDIRPEAMP